MTDGRTVSDLVLSCGAALLFCFVLFFLIPSELFSQREPDAGSGFPLVFKLLLVHQCLSDSGVWNACVFLCMYIYIFPYLLKKLMHFMN